MGEMRCGWWVIGREGERGGLGWDEKVVLG